MPEKTLTFLLGINDRTNQDHYPIIAGILGYEVILAHSAMKLIRVIK